MTDPARVAVVTGAAPRPGTGAAVSGQVLGVNGGLHPGG